MQIALFISSWATVGLVLLMWYFDNKRQDEALKDVLDRISTEPRIELRPRVPEPITEPSARRYIADHEADDAAWNEYRGEPQEDE
jgi:hypothetical protein